MKMITAFDAISGKAIFPRPVTEAQFDHWYDNHADWRAVRDIAEVNPLLGEDVLWLVQEQD